MSEQRAPADLPKLAARAVLIDMDGTVTPTIAHGDYMARVLCELTAQRHDLSADRAETMVRSVFDLGNEPIRDTYLDSLQIGFDEYWQIAGELIEELVDVSKPEAFFHVGMDEDHYRSLTQYVEAINILRGLVARHKLRTIIWNDSCHFKKTAIAQVHADKCRSAEEHLPRDIVHVLWDYNQAHPAIVKRLAQQGFTVWGAPGRRPNQVKNWRNAISANGRSGLLMTNWIKCCKRNEAELLDMIERLAPLYA